MTPGSPGLSRATYVPAHLWCHLKACVVSRLCAASSETMVASVLEWLLRSRSKKEEWTQVKYRATDQLLCCKCQQTWVNRLMTNFPTVTLPEILTTVSEGMNGHSPESIIGFYCIYHVFQRTEIDKRLGPLSCTGGYMRPHIPSAWCFHTCSRLISIPRPVSPTIVESPQIHRNKVECTAIIYPVMRFSCLTTTNNNNNINVHFLICERHAQGKSKFLHGWCRGNTININRSESWW